MSEARQPLHPSALRLEAPNGLLSYPPVEKWDDWIEYDPAHWPRSTIRSSQRFALTARPPAVSSALSIRKPCASADSKATQNIQAAGEETVQRGQPH
jgi:hypothetical protein